MYSTVAKKVKTESIRKFRDFNLQWTKTLYQNNLNSIAFYLRFSRAIEIINVKFHKNCENTGKILKISCVRCNFVNFDIRFLELPQEIFFGVITDN